MYNIIRWKLHELTDLVKLGPRTKTIIIQLLNLHNFCLDTERLSCSLLVGEPEHVEIQ